jgi:hypothetical protein
MHAQPTDAPAAAVHGAGKAHSPSAHSPSDFKLEQLEPRLLLSADSPLVAVVAKSLLENEAGANGASGDANVQQLDAATSAEIAAVRGSDCGDAQAAAAPTVAWGKGWTAAASEDAVSVNDSAVVATVETGVPDSNSGADPGPEAALVEQAAATSAKSKTRSDDGDSSAADSSDQDVVAGTVPGSQLPRGPPADDPIASALIATEVQEINELSFSDSPREDEGADSGVQKLLVSNVYDDGFPRGPPDAAALTDEILSPLLEAALRLWSASGLTADLSNRLANLDVRIADLPDGELGETDGNLITLDATAAGRGWFVDPTPGEHSEFTATLSGFRSAATADSAAFGRIDLLTVLAHEVGHVLGLDHDSGLAVMEEDLGSGQRVLPGYEALLIGVDGSMAGTLNIATAGTLAADGSDTNPITFTIVNHGGNAGIPDVTVTGAGSNNGTYDDITTITGRAAFGDSIVVSVAGATTWTMTGASAGSVAIAGFTSPVQFSNVGNYSGAGNVTVNGAVSLGGNATIASTGGNVHITGTVNGAHSLTLTTGATGTVTLDGVVGGTTPLTDLIVTADGNVVAAGAVTLTGRLNFASTNGNITLNGAVSAAGNVRLDTSLVNTATVNKAIQSSAGNISVVAGDVVQGADGNLIVGGGGKTIDVEALLGTITMAAGSIAQTAGGNIRYNAFSNAVIAQLDARTATDRTSSTTGDQANWGRVSIFSQGGSISDTVATANVFASATRLTAHGGIGSADSSIKLEVITVSASAGAGGINLNDFSQITVNTVDRVPVNRVQANGSTATEQDAADQSDLVTTANGNIILRTTNGGIVINDGTAPADTNGINANGSGAVTLQAKGASQTLTVNAKVRSGSGAITVQAPLMMMNPSDLITSGTVSILTGASVFDVNLVGSVEWVSQGPIQTTGGQILGMDDQGKPVSGAIQAIAVDPRDPNVVYVASVNGGVWKTTNVNATKLVEFNDPAKADGPNVSGVVYTASDVFAFSAALDTTVGNDGTGKFDPVPAAVTTGGGNGTTVPHFATLGSVADKNRLIFTAATASNDFNNVSVVLVDALAAAGSETAHYDVASKTLTIFIKKGASTAIQIRDAVNKAGALTSGNAGTGATATATMKAASATASDAGSGYAIGNTITLAGGTSTQAAVLTVQTVKVVGNPTIANAGTGYAVDDILTVTGGTGITARLKVLAVTGGQITSVAIERAGSYSAIPTGGALAVTGGTGTGATFTVNWGVNTVTVTTAGAYSVLPANPVAQGSTNGTGTGATFVIGWSIHAVTVTSGGAGYNPVPSVQAVGGGGSGSCSRGWAVLGRRRPSRT